MHKRKFGLLLMLAAGLLAGCGSSSKEEQGSVIHYVTPQEIATMDSTKLDDMPSANFSAQVQDGLYWEDSENKVHPALAESLPEVSDDALHYTVKMRQDAKWSNGDPITAHDFVYAVQRLADPDTAASYSYLLEDFKNGQQVLKGELPVDQIGVKALDDYTIQIDLERPVPYMEHLLSFAVFYPLNEKFVEDQGDKYGTSSDTILYSGPFKMEDWDGVDTSWKLVKNPDYYAADDVKVDQVDVQVIKDVNTGINLYEGGKVDNAPITGELVKQYKDSPDAVTQQKARSNYMEFNFNRPELQNVNLRKAIIASINNQELTDIILGDGSVPLSTFVPKGFLRNPESGQDFTDEIGIGSQYSPEDAAKYWDQAKEELGTDHVELTLLGDDQENLKKVCEYIQGQIQNNLPGVTVQIQTVPKKNRLAMSKTGDFDLVLGGWSADFSDGINFYANQTSDSPFNFGKYNNPDYDAAIKRAEGQDANDEMARYRDFMEAQKIQTETASVVPLYQEVDLQLRSPRVTNITFRPVNTEFDLRTAEVNK